MLKLKYPHAGVFSVCRLGRDEWNKCRGKHSGFSIGDVLMIKKVCLLTIKSRSRV